MPHPRKNINGDARVTVHHVHVTPHEEAGHELAAGCKKYYVEIKTAEDARE